MDHDYAAALFPVDEDIFGDENSNEANANSSGNDNVDAETDSMANQHSGSIESDQDDDSSEEPPQHLNPSVVIIENGQYLDDSDDDLEDEHLEDELDEAETDVEYEDDDDEDDIIDDDSPSSQAAESLANNMAEDLIVVEEGAEEPENVVTNQPLLGEENNDYEVEDEDNDRPSTSSIFNRSRRSVSQPAQDIINAMETPSRKRKRESLVSPKTNTPKIKASDYDDDEDDGLTCPICLDTWEMSGEHRLVALRCGHLFGDICIRRWLSESARQNGIKMCPQCKTKASNKDIRCLYARRVRALDRTEEHNLRAQLDEERKKNSALETEMTTMKMTSALLKTRIEKLERDNDLLRRTSRQVDHITNGRDGIPVQIHKIFLERNIEITREAGCRVMTFSDKQNSLIVSQKSSQNLFPGYGVRFINTNTFRTSNYLPTSSKLLRDICLSADQQLLAVASMEPRTKLFDLRTRQSVAQFVTNSASLWSCAIDSSEHRQHLYLGAQIGITYVYDLRNPKEVLHEYSREGEDSTPVIQLAPVPAGKFFPNGGFLVCTLRNLWFYEHIGADQPHVTRLNIEGPFISMNYNSQTEILLVSTRGNVSLPNSRYMLGTLEKMEGTPLFNMRVIFTGAKSAPVMTRAAQITVESNTLVAGYVQDSKVLSLYDMRREICLQSVPVQEVVYDTCPVYTMDATFLAALTENKCRIYKLHSSN